MPLDHGYGVAIGTLASFTREDPSDFGPGTTGCCASTRPRESTRRPWTSTPPAGWA